MVIAFIVGWAAEFIAQYAMSLPNPPRHPQVSLHAVLATLVAAAGCYALAGVISVALLFREPVWKSVAAFGLVLVVEALFSSVYYLWFILFFFRSHML